MTTVFPVGLDDYSDPAATDSLVGHAQKHTNLNDAVEALEAKVGINGSAVATSLDKRVSDLEGAGGGGTWGTITGTLSNQTDLQTALNLKANTSALAAVALSGAYADLIGEPAQFNPIAGTNMSLTGSYPNITFNASGGGGGGSTIYSGVAVIDFGAIPGSQLTSVVITGQTFLVALSKIKAWVVMASTAEHNVYEHMAVPIRLVIGDVSVGVGFTIYAVSDFRLTGTFNLNWEWS